MNQSEPHIIPRANEGQLAVDVIETREHIIIRSVIAGIDPEHLDIHITSDLVTIRGTRHEEEIGHDATIHYRECFWGTFSRSIILPHHVKPDEADATFANGVLQLTIPKTIGEMNIKVRNLSEE